MVRLRERGMNIGKIAKTLANDDCKISRLSVRRFLKRFQERQSFENAPLPGRPAEDVTPELMSFIDKQMEQNDELTAPNFRKKIFEEFEVMFSESKVKRLRKKLGWVHTGTKYCQLIREPNRAKRLEFCSAKKTVKHSTTSSFQTNAPCTWRNMLS